MPRRSLFGHRSLSFDRGALPFDNRSTPLDRCSSLFDRRGLPFVHLRSVAPPSTCLLLALLLLTALLSPSLVSAAVPQPFVWEEFAQRIARSTAVSPHGAELMGDQVSLSNGALSFAVTDAAVPGNDALPVAFARSYAMVNRKDDPVSDGMLADWQVEVPSISGVFATDWVVGLGHSKQRCTDGAAPVSPEQFLSTEDFFHGLTITTHAGSSDLLRTAETTARPSAGGPWRWVTNDQTHVSCLPTLSNGPGQGEGFLAVTADGTKYWFDAMAQTAEPRLRLVQSVLNMPPSVHLLQRKKNWLYATRVEDRFGNHVLYSYANAWNQPPRLTKIQASDGRTLTLGYVGNRISSVSNGTQTWTYSYGTTPKGRATLTGVTLPDASTWSIGFGAFTDAEIDYVGTDPNEPQRDCRMNPPPIGAGLGGNDGVETTATITHPSGATATFAVDLQEHGRSSVPLACNFVVLPVNDVSDDVNLWATSAYAYTLKRKTLSGPGLTPAQWTYRYTPNLSVYMYPGTTLAKPVCDWNSVDCSKPPCLDDGCARASETDVYGPDGVWTRYHHGNTYRYNEGKLLKVEHGAWTPDNDDPDTTPQTAVWRTVTHRYDLSRKDVAYRAVFGTSQREKGEGFPSEYHRPLLSTDTTQQGVHFTRTHEAFDAFAQPLTVRRASTLGFVRTEAIVYANASNPWVIGQIKSVGCVSASPTPCNGEVMASATYDPATALPLTIGAFGQVQQTLTYDTASTIASGQRGTVKTIQDANGKTTTLSQWHRGVPRLVKQPDATQRSALVSDLGWITQVTNELGHATHYGHDPMGRLTTITWPTGDSTAWATTQRSFEKINATEYGIAKQHWRLTETTGNAVKKTYYDALWRPLLVHEYDAANLAATQRFVKRAFDIDGRETFASYPGTGAALTTGTWTEHDVLGRVTAVAQDSELGLLTTATAYEAGFTTRVTRPGNQHTLTTHVAWDEPTLDWPRFITHPQGAYTDIGRDPWGKPTRVARRNANSSLSAVRSYVYDTHQRLCKQIEPETASTVFAYDPAGNLTWSASGQALPSTTACNTANVAANQKIVRTYTARHQLHTLSFPDGRGNQTWTYTPDGLPETIVTDNGDGNTVTNTYAYNRRRLMTSQTMAWGSLNYVLTHGYDALGHRASDTYLDGGTIQYAPNALGQPTRAGNHVTHASYFPNGAIKQFTWANGLVRKITQNARQLPSNITDTGSGVTPVNLGTTYDPRGNVDTTTDHLPGGRQTRSMTYDGLDRLLTTTSPMIGTATYTYDVLDNLKSTKLTGGNQPRNHSYVHDANQRLTQIRQTVGNALVDTLTYDPRGNLASKGGLTYNFDHGHRLRTIPGLASYVYDGHGRRVRDVTTASRYSLYAADGRLMFTNDARRAMKSYFIYLGQTLVAISEQPTSGGATTVKYQHTDAQGTPIAETNAARTITQTSEYEPYGRLANRAITDAPGYTGHLQDAASGLTYMQQRYYDPQIGRFLSVDPVTANATTGANFNRYWYANNNPYKFFDPDGQYVCSGKENKCLKFDGAIDSAKKAANSGRISADQIATLRAAVEFFGEKDQRGVNIYFDNLNGDYARINTDRKGRGSVIFDLDVIAKKNPGDEDTISGLAMRILHEGDHGVRIVNSGFPPTRFVRTEREKSGYRAEAYYQKAMNFLQNGGNMWAPWNPGDGFDNEMIDSRANLSVESSCKLSSEGNC